MVRAGAVVAQALAGEGAEEDRAGVAQQRLPALRVARADLEVLGRDAVADLAGLFHAARQDQRAAAFERRRGSRRGAACSGSSRSIAACTCAM